MILAYFLYNSFYAEVLFWHIKTLKKSFTSNTPTKEVDSRYDFGLTDMEGGMVKHIIIPSHPYFP